ncbi:LOW QUALITY PROTEIN: origin recognition complex subunit 1 [Bombina bombina]|uniref:LOW QUALITY PROTEIN: origin recognition complex subunit 1 n=1 Tax=Bombina bombina TaxID=8345 RepID=UPI00235AE285|nr:LOW QUALITY PROTEIN: origin recognition complex subunit 1 [Bombina bombina]
MTKYCTRVRRRRIYVWTGRPLLKDRKMLSFSYGGLIMKSAGSDVEVQITPGDFILIEGEDEDRPFVARLVALYDDGTDKDVSKHAIVQWFVRYEEIPFKKRKLLGREPHPQEIFFYDVKSCENDIDAETIIGTVQVMQLTERDVFHMQKNSADVLFVKLAWNGKAFKPLASCVLRGGNGTKSNGLVPPNSLPQPNFYPAEADTAENRLATRSATKAQRPENEIESRHSASKSSHSKARGDISVSSGSNTPSARKKLQLNSPPKCGKPISTQQDLLDQLMDEDFKVLEVTAPKRKVAFCGLLGSPPKKSLSELEEAMGMHAVTLKPLQNGTGAKTKLRLTPYRRLQQTDGRQNEDQSLIKNTRSKATDEADKSTKLKVKTPQKLEATPKRNTSQSHRRSHDSQDETEPRPPRSRRRSAQESASKFRKQLQVLQNSDISEGEDEDDFVPLKDSSVFSSSEEESEEAKPQRKAEKKGGTAPRTPTSSKNVSSRTPSKTSVSRTPRLATPRIPERNQPVRKPGNVLEEARIRLHVSAVPESLPCREQEFQDIYNFVESKLLDATGGCMYISGVPGTGKTATVHEVIRSLERAVEEEELPSFHYIEINGMKLTDPHQAYVQILKLLTGQKATADHAATLLDKRFNTPAPKRETTVLLVDELDLLWTRKQNVMYNLFDWPTRKQAKLIVLAIANTMDLPERIMMNRVASRLGLTRMSFQPYTHKQLQQIITSRLNHVKAFDDDAIQLVSRKVAALSGDARRCLDICRRATEICEFSSKEKEFSLVKMPHVIDALEEMFSSPYVLAIRSSSVLEQAFLKAVIAEFRRSGLEEATFQQVYRQHIALCRIEGLQPPSMSETMAVCLRLGASRLLLVESSRNDLHLRVRINVSQDDIMYALKGD